MAVQNSEILLTIGFVDIGAWVRDKGSLKVELRGLNASANTVLLSESRALYAFCDRGGAVFYIGKTAQSLDKRFRGYRNPHKGQKTNWRCHHLILERLDEGREVRVLVFPMSAHLAHLRYADYSINLAAGLEDSLIESFNPPWNGHSHGKPVTEDAEREIEQQGADTLPAAVMPDRTGKTSFEIQLHPTYLSAGDHKSRCCC